MSTDEDLKRILEYPAIELIHPFGPEAKAENKRLHELKKQIEKQAAQIEEFREKLGGG